MPDAIENAPELLPGLELYLWAYYVLDSERTSNGFSSGPIPRHVVREYAEEYGFDEEQTEALHYHVRKLDVVQAEHEKRQREQRISENPPPYRMKRKR